MSTEPNPAVTQALSIEAEALLAEALMKIENRAKEITGELHLKTDAFVTREDFSALTNKLDDFKNEVVRIAGQVEEVSKRLNMAFEEIRLVGGKALDRVPIEPAKKAGRALTLLEFGED